MKFDEKDASMFIFRENQERGVTLILKIDQAGKKTKKQTLPDRVSNRPEELSSLSQSTNQESTLVVR